MAQLEADAELGSLKTAAGQASPDGEAWIRVQPDLCDGRGCGAGCSEQLFASGPEHWNGLLAGTSRQAC